MVNILLFSLFTIIADVELNEDKIIFNENKKYNYEATFTNKSGAIVSKEIITLSPLGEPWKWDKNQTSFKVDYNYTLKDSTAFLSYINPISKNPKKPKPYIWYKSIITGAIENDSAVWMHPFRDNQYEHTEVAPFPDIKKSLLKKDSTWKNILSIMLGGGNFNGKVISTYKVIKNEDRIYGSLNLKDCWLINAVGEHNKLGKSYLNFYYHPEYGFVEMNYTFYDGVKINFVLKNVIVTK